MIVLVHAAATWVMVGVIWVMQLVHYPLMRLVGVEHFKEYEQGHQKRISLIVVPVMSVELGASVWLLLDPSQAVAVVWRGAGVILLILIWGLTLFVQGPLHRLLADGFDAGLHRRLVRSNWLRTLLWSARGVLAATFLT